MPMPKRITVTGSSGVSTPWMPSYCQDPFAIGIGVVPSASGVIYTVQHTFDPIFSDGQVPGITTVLASLATWHNHTSLVAASCALDGNYAFPVLGIRLKTSSTSSATGSVYATFVQAGP